MPTDVFYGAECVASIGVMADKDTDPTAWYALEFVTLTVTPDRPKRQRPKVGRTRHNVLDPTKPISGLKKVSAELVVEADTRHFPRLLHVFFGPATTTGPASLLYTHVWSSGSKTPKIAALQIQIGTGDVRIYRGLALNVLGFDFDGEKTRDNDLKLSLVGLDYEKADALIGDAPSALPVEAVCFGVSFMVDDVEATNLLSGSFNFDRGLQQEAFVSSTPEYSGVRSNGTQHSGQAKFRANAEVFDDIGNADTVFDTKVKLLGVATGEYIQLEHTNCMLSGPPAVPIPGPGLIERDIAWMGHQGTAAPATKITVVNPVASYTGS